MSTSQSEYDIYPRVIEKIKFEFDKWLLLIENFSNKIFKLFRNAIKFD